MWPSVLLALDHFDRVLVWSGADVAGADHDALRAACAAHLAASPAVRRRFPAPPIVQLRDGSSMSRYLECRLAPSHKDPPERQLARFDALAELAGDELARVRARFHPTDDLTYQEYIWRVIR